MPLGINHITVVERKEPLKLNIGCGDMPIEGYINIDKHKHKGVDKVLDVVEGLPYDDGSTKVIYSHHFLEHLNIFEVQKHLSDCYRVMQRGGQLIINTPDFEGLLKEYQEGKREWNDFMTQLFGYQESKGMGHKTIFTKQSLEELVKNAGFKDIVTVYQSQCDSPGMRLEAFKK